MSDNYIVYAHVNKINGKPYFGITCQNINQRWRNGKGYENCVLFDKAISKYGWDNFEHIIIAEGLEEQEAKDMEKKLISKYKANDHIHGYNISCGGDGNGGRKLTEEQRKNVSDGRKGKCVGKDNPLYGKPMDKKDVSKRAKSFKDNYKKENHPMYNKELSEAQKIGCKVGASLIKEERRKPVAQLNKDTGEVIATFDGVREAARTLGYDNSSIAKCCRGVQKTAYGYKWEYIEKIPKEVDTSLIDRCILQIDPFTEEVIYEYKSIREAANETNISRSSIHGVAKRNGYAKTAGGFIWIYKDEYKKEEVA